MVRLKSFNVQRIYIGAPGTGKSWRARRDAWALARATGAYVLMHDPTHSMDGDRAVPHRRYSSLQALAAGLAKYGGSVVHILDVDDADEVLRAAISLAAQSMARAVGGEFHPVIVLIDEIVMSEGLNPHAISPLWRTTIARRRHLGVSPFLTAQSAHFGHRAVLTLATEIRVFRIADPADEKRLISVGLDPAVARTIRALPDRHSVVIRNGRTFLAA